MQELRGIVQKRYYALRNSLRKQLQHFTTVLINMEKIDNSIAGKFLISTRNMPDPRFAEQVIYICSHTAEDGALGVAVNCPAGDISLAEVFADLDVLPSLSTVNVHLGGPVDHEAGFILYERGRGYEMEGVLEVSEKIALTRERKVLEDIVTGKGPSTFLFVLGYAGWGPGQLEAELTRNGWLVVPGDSNIIFRLEDSEKWQAAAQQYGIDINLFEDETGNA